MHLQFEPAQSLEGREIDVVDQGPEGIADFVAVGRIDRFLDRLGQSLVGRRRARSLTRPA